MSDKRQHADIEGPESIADQEVAALFDKGSERMDKIEAQVQAIKSDVEEVLDILRLGKAFFRILGYIGVAIKWTAAVAAPVIALIYTLKSGGKI